MPDNFVVEAEAAWPITTGATGSEIVEIVARVKDQNGDPVKGLKKSNFSVVVPGTGFMTIEGFIDVVSAIGWESLPGTYRLSLIPSLENVRGQLVFVLRVKKTQKAGQFTVTKAGQTLIAVVKLQ